MVDGKGNPWLIEVNSSPSLGYSTKLTERLVRTMLEDTVKVVVDYGMSKK
jgi:tubulin monoglycylase TTLL3/8